MSKPPSVKRTLLRIGIILFMPIALIGGCVAFDAASISRAKPPESVRSLEDFLLWKGADVRGRGTFETSGVTYTVMFGQPARSLASGPSAYLFDTNGQFVDWTADMGDFYTVKHRFNLTSGRVKNIEREKP